MANNNHSALCGALAELSALIPARADRLRPSPNFDERPRHVSGIACVVLHATADNGSEESAETWLCSSESRVSAHLHIRRDGTVVRLVNDQHRAWHAGASVWKGARDVNDFSLGWEIANRNNGKEAYSAAQYRALARLAAHYIEQGIALNAFVSHEEVAVPTGRKTDPANFDWIGFKMETLRQLAGNGPRTTNGE